MQTWKTNEKFCKPWPYSGPLLGRPQDIETKKKKEPREEAQLSMGLNYTQDQDFSRCYLASPAHVSPFSVSHLHVLFSSLSEIQRIYIYIYNDVIYTIYNVKPNKTKSTP